MSEPAFAPTASFKEIISAINECQRSGSAAAAGERFSAAILEKTEEELTKMADELDKEGGDTLVECLVAAENSLKQRHHLVKVAICRLGVVIQKEQGGANV